MGLIRPTVSDPHFKIKFEGEGWDRQFPGICTLKETPKLPAAHKSMSVEEFIVHCRTLMRTRGKKIFKVVLDGAHRTELGTGKNANDNGVYIPVMPKIPSDKRNVIALNSNELAATVNATEYLDKLSTVMMKREDGYTINQIVE